MKHELSASAPTPPAASTPGASPTAATEAVVSVSEAAKKPGFKLDPRYIAPLFITCILIAAQFFYGVLGSWTLTGAAIITAIFLELVLSKVFTGKWPMLASAYISGISVGILIKAPNLWPYALCAALSITSKYVLRVKGRHIWNPSNFGICAMLLLAHDSVATLSIQFGNNIWPMIIIWCLGSFIISRLKRFHITLTYVLSFIAFAFLRSLILHDNFATEIAPITGPMYQLYIFFMITDPKTTVSTKKGQMLVAFLVAAAEHALRLMHNVHAPYFALFIVGPIANLVDMALNPPKKPAAPPTSAVPSTA
jgi:Na+-translocating ferredoxin:NAD+ oxidoreductase RnfD subunit